MPATSKAQQRAMCMALAARKGDLEVSKLKGAALEIYKSKMTNKEIEDFTILKENINNKRYMKANNIEEFFGTLQQATVEAWKEHLKTDKYSKHIALNEFYEDIVELVDTLIEDYMGIYGKVSDYKNIMTTEKIGAVEYLESLREMCKEAADDLFDDDKDSELLSDIDNILSLIDSTLYKLKELKENSGIKSLTNFIQESLNEQNVNEAQQIEYHVSFLTTKGEDGSPYTVKIFVDKKYQRNFENFLDNEEDSIFYHAVGGTVEY